MPRRKKSDVADIKAHAKEDTARHTKALTWKDMVPTGSTLLNLAISGDHRGGFPLGRISNTIGDRSSGKTFVGLTSLAMAAHLERFDDYELYHDDAEWATSFDMSHLFGKKTAMRIQPPGGLDKDGNAINSKTVEDLEMFIHKKLDSSRPFLYLLDSLDSLDAEADAQKSQEMMEARMKGKTVTGSYGMAKAKKMSELLRRIVSKLEGTRSMLHILSQTRDDINPRTFSTKTRSGGKALGFYSSIEMWLAVAGYRKKTINKMERKIGMVSKIKISKNKINGRVRELEIPIYYDYGIDDIGSCIDFLVREKVWDKSLRSIDAKGLGIKATPEKLISIIENEKKEERLSEIVQETWDNIEESLKSSRVRRF